MKYYGVDFELFSATEVSLKNNLNFEVTFESEALLPMDPFKCHLTCFFYYSLYYSKYCYKFETYFAMFVPVLL